MWRIVNERLNDQVIKQSERKEELIDSLSYIRNILDERRNIPVKTTESSEGTYIQYHSDSNTYLKALLLVQYLESMEAHFIEIMEKLKNTRSSWKMK